MADFSDFDRYCQDHAILPEDAPVAFAAWLHEISGGEWDGEAQQVWPPPDESCERYRLLADDPQFGMFAGDVLLCVPYALDPIKLTVVRRESDGFDPCCNIYRSQVKNVKFSK